MQQHPNTIIIYTDGACSGNPGPGAFAAILMYQNKTKQIAQAFQLTTNNRMELRAVIAALQQLKTTTLPIKIYTDSKYVADAIHKKWLNKWITTQFKNKKNKDLWMLYTQVAQPLNIELIWVKGHASNEYNNRCDALAVACIQQKKYIIDQGYEP